MKILKFNELNVYNNIKSNDKYYQVPFDLFEKGKCIKGEDEFVLCFSNSFVYDYISDEDIKKSLKKDLTNIDVSKDWTNFIIKYETAYDNKEYHSLRVAKIVSEIKNGNPITPISLFFDERSYQCDIKNFIDDGNHRIRALQFLKYDYFPAFIYGNFSKYLIELLDNFKF